jgi:hypothetical protein
MSDDRAMNVAHSPLVQATTAVSASQPDYALERELLDARRKFSSSLESSVLDYLHYGPQALEDCVKTMHTLCSNILEHPEDPKYRKVGQHRRLTLQETQQGSCPEC